MINIRDEGEPVKYGINFYPLNSASSGGFVLKFWPKRALFVRYSKGTKKFYIKWFKAK